MNFWKNKRVWIIGASSGIGEGLLSCLVKEEAKVVISARRTERMEELTADIPSSWVKILPIDMEVHECLSAKTKEAWEMFGGLDVVFLNAGISVRDLVSETSLDLEKKLMDINFWGAVVVTKALLQVKPENHPLQLAVTSSLSGKYGVPKLAAYAASKHALHGYFESLRAETAQSNVRIHLVIPGFIKTEITVSGYKGDGSPNGKIQHALQNGMDPEKCAQLILKGVQQGKEEFVVGGMEKFTLLFNRLFPSLNRRLIRSNPLQKLQRIKSFFGIKKA
mgnify:CR=1 FL=1